MAEYLLDQDQKFVVLGPDEYIWCFVWEAESNGIIKSWHAYNKTPGTDLFLPRGSWPESSVCRFLNRHQHKLNGDDRIDLYQYLHKGGFEMWLQKNRIRS